MTQNQVQNTLIAQDMSQLNYQQLNALSLVANLLLKNMPPEIKKRLSEAQNDTDMYNIFIELMEVMQKNRRLSVEEKQGDLEEAMRQFEDYQSAMQKAEQDNKTLNGNVTDKNNYVKAFNWGIFGSFFMQMFSDKKFWMPNQGNQALAPGVNVYNTEAKATLSGKLQVAQSTIGVDQTALTNIQSAMQTTMSGKFAADTGNENTYGQSLNQDLQFVSQMLSNWMK
ncbi:MAG: hypothetical protein HZB76_06190 [Chlamydiae bacterium]|nr:hypothetical protein [Chlamydiota bacterium]